MASTYLSLHYHLVFGTKHREPCIASPVAHRACMNTWAGRFRASVDFRKGSAVQPIMSICSSV